MWVSWVSGCVVEIMSDPRQMIKRNSFSVHPLTQNALGLFGVLGVVLGLLVGGLRLLGLPFPCARRGLGGGRLQGRDLGGKLLVRRASGLFRPP